MAPQVYGYHVKCTQVARVYFIAHVRMHTRCATALQIPQNIMQMAPQVCGYRVKPHTNGHKSISLCTLNCMQDVPQLCGYHVKIHTDGPTGMRIPPKKHIQMARVYSIGHVRMHSRCPTAMRMPMKMHTNSPTGMRVPRKNAYKWHESISLCTYKCIQNVPCIELAPQLCGYHVKMLTNCTSLLHCACKNAYKMPSHSH